MPVHAGSNPATEGPVAQYELRCSLRAPLPIERTFEAFEDPHNLSKITPRWLRFVIRSSDRLDMRRGLEIDYTIRWLGLPMRWRSVISEYEPPYLFVDEQVVGPYASWRHRHEFSRDADSTIVADRVRYSLPFGALGAAAHAAMVRRQLLGIFGFRQFAIGRLLGVECRTIDRPVVISLR